MNLSDSYVKSLSSTHVRVIILRGIGVMFKLKISRPFKLNDPNLARWMERLEQYRD